MSRKPIMLALAAAVSLGAFALSASTASAFHPSGNNGVHAVSSGAVKVLGGGGLHVNYVPHVNSGKFYKVWPTFNPQHHVHGPRWWWWRYTWRRPYWNIPVIATGGVAAGVATYAATAPATNRCTCLTKDYTPQGAVVFKDVCTNEMAMNPPVNASPAADMAPQMQQPMQQGYLQPQVQ